MSPFVVEGLAKPIRSARLIGCCVGRLFIHGPLFRGLLDRFGVKRLYLQRKSYYYWSCHGGDGFLRASPCKIVCSSVGCSVYVICHCGNPSVACLLLLIRKRPSVSSGMSCWNQVQCCIVGSTCECGMRGCRGAHPWWDGMGTEWGKEIIHIVPCCGDVHQVELKYCIVCTVHG